MELLGDEIETMDHLRPIQLDKAAFRREGPNSKEALGTEVKLYCDLTKMSVAEALRMVLAQIPTKNATYLLRSGVVVVTTRDRASVGTLLRDPVEAAFERVPFTQAVEELAYQTGACVNFDPRASDQLQMRVTAAFTNQVTFHAALVTLTDMADLTVVRLGESLYVTTPERARRLRGVAGRLRGEGQRRPPGPLPPAPEREPGMGLGI